MSALSFGSTGQVSLDTRYDLIVIGSGASGLSAAQAGLSVAILEKRSQTGVIAALAGASAGGAA
jgi:flavin-dependent dehydrogenase